MTASQLRDRRPREGAVAGHVLRSARSAASLTQEQFSGLAGVDTTTVQSWESGRRPLLLVKAGTLITVKNVLHEAGVDPRLVSALNTALDADLLLDVLVRGPYEDARRGLDTRVLPRTLVDLLTWPFKSTMPHVVASACVAPQRRGLATPRLGAADMRAAFTRLREISESSYDAGLARRQALYLASFDESADGRAWLSSVQRRTNWQMHARTFGPRWAEARSVVTSLAKLGDPEPVERFVAMGRGDDSWEIANLNYFAYWAGAMPSPQRDDSFMQVRQARWDEAALLTHLAGRMDVNSPLLALTTRTLWSLIAATPQLLDEDRALVGELAERTAAIADHTVLPRPVVDDLSAVRVALRLAQTRSAGR